MSHELRTPMNAILGFAQLLQREKRDPLSAKNLERVAQMVFRSFEATTLITRTNAEDGLLAAQALLPDVILIGINLPRMSGIEALSALRADARTRHIPVVALTAAASRRDVQDGLRAGFLRYLTKPIRIDELTSALAAAYRGRASPIHAGSDDGGGPG